MHKKFETQNYVILDDVTDYVTGTVRSTQHGLKNTLELSFEKRWNWFLKNNFKNI